MSDTDQLWIWFLLIMNYLVPYCFCTNFMQFSQFCQVFKLLHIANCAVNRTMLSWALCGGDNAISVSFEGPNSWSHIYPDCSGPNQSPINIDKQNVRFSTHLITFDLPGYETIPRGAHWELLNSGNMSESHWTFSKCQTLSIHLKL